MFEWLSASGTQSQTSCFYSGLFNFCPSYFSADLAKLVASG